jgi:multidrug efflux pump subunit AcrA (membrane-fusion protein)
VRINEKIWGRIVQIILLVFIAIGLFTMIFLYNEKNRMTNEPEKEKKSSSGAQISNTSDAVAVETYEIVLRDIFKSIRVNGDVTTESSIDIYPDTSGKLANLKIKLGDKVLKNNIIAYVDPSLPGQDYSLSPVRSTIDGTVTVLPMKVGDKVTTQTSVATVGDLKTLQITSYIPERYISTLQNGLQADIVFDAYPNEKFKGVITSISPIMDINTRTLEITLTLTEHDERIRPGMFASLQLITEQRINTLVVPAQALLSYYNEKVVYIINSENMAERRTITTGLTTDESVEVLSGLTAGDIVITQGLNKLTEGTLVRSVSGEKS